jgi:hypothetical protein
MVASPDPTGRVRYQLLRSSTCDGYRWPLTGVVVGVGMVLGGGVVVEVGVGVGVGVGVVLVVGVVTVVGVGAVVEVDVVVVEEVGVVVAAAKAATQPRELTEVVHWNPACCGPAVPVTTSSLTIVPVAPVTWARSEAGTPAMDPPEAVTPLSAFMAPANTSDPRGMETVDEVVSVV